MQIYQCWFIFEKHIFFNEWHKSYRKNAYRTCVFPNKLPSSVQPVCSRDFPWKMYIRDESAHMTNFIDLTFTLFANLNSWANASPQGFLSKRTQFLIFICISARISFNKFTSAIYKTHQIFNPSCCDCSRFFSSWVFYNQKIVTVTN